MWLLELVFGVALIAGCTSTTLEGDHVCPQEERYMVNVTREVLQKVKIRNYKWCMNVPPRCSYYTDEEKYVPETIQQEETRLVDKCCPDYQEDETGVKCIPLCPSCIHGECDSNNKCNCQPGFWGNVCDTECPKTRWGRNCQSDCLCENGDCDPVTGHCTCHPGWQGTRCEEQFPSIPEEIQINDTTTTTSATTTMPTTTQTLPSKKTTTFIPNLDQRLKKNSAQTKYPIFQKYYTFFKTTENPSHTTKFKSEQRLNEIGSWQPTRTQSSTEKNAATAVLNAPTFPNTKLTSVTWLSGENVEGTTIYNHIKPSISSEQRDNDLTTQPSTEVDTVQVPVAHVTTTLGQDDEAKQEQEFVNSEITHQVDSVITQPSHANLKAKVVDGLEVSVTSTRAKEEDWLNDESRLGPANELSIHQNQTPIKESHLVFSIGAAAGVIATIILIVAVAVLGTQTFKGKKPAAANSTPTSTYHHEKGDGGVPAVSIYARSVFHAPLPDPPVFENPVFTTPIEFESNGGTLETRVICSMHLPTQPNYRRDSRVVDAFYDHPPSTGSYRAASIPEPPEQTLEATSSELKEHLYDEIPCWKQPLTIMQPTDSLHNESLSYYANAMNSKSTKF